MNRLFLILLVMASTVLAIAGDYIYLTLRTADGGETPMAVDKLRLTVSNGQLVATNSDGSVTFPLNELRVMYFSNNASGISTDIVSVPNDGAVEVYTTGGVLVGRYDSLVEAKGTLKRGIYVMKTNDKTFKIVLQ